MLRICLTEAGEMASATELPIIHQAKRFSWRPQNEGFVHFLFIHILLICLLKHHCTYP